MSALESNQCADDSWHAMLLRQAKAGSGSSLGQLLQSCRDHLLRLADQELGSDLKVKVSPSDIVQDSFLEAQRDFRQFEGTTPAEFKAWLRQLATNNLGNVARGFRATDKRDIARERNGDAQRELTVQLPDRNSPSAATRTIDRERMELLRRALAELPGHYRDIIQLRNYERHSFETIGQLTNRSAEASRKVWARAIELLQQKLDGLNDSTRISPGFRVRRDSGQV